MRIILLKDVENLGQAGDVKEVANGYARNFLIPRGLVVEASPAQLKRLESLRARAQRERERAAQGAQAMAERLSKVTVTVPARVGEGGRLFGSVTNQDVATALQEQHGIAVDRRDVELAEPIRILGVHQVPVRVGAGVAGQLVVEVVPETAPPS